MGCRVGHRGGGEGSDRCGLVLGVGQVCDSVGDCWDVLLDADSTHSVPRQRVPLSCCLCVWKMSLPAD